MLLVKTLNIIAAGMLLLSPALWGQLDHKLTMQVPFDFVAGNHQFSAGDYTITSGTAAGTSALRTGDQGPMLVPSTYSAGDHKDASIENSAPGTTTVAEFCSSLRFHTLCGFVFNLVLSGVPHDPGQRLVLLRDLFKSFVEIGGKRDGHADCRCV
jgi:hypothetical protein